MPIRSRSLFAALGAMSLLGADASGAAAAAWRDGQAGSAEWRLQPPGPAPEGEGGGEPKDAPGDAPAEAEVNGESRLPEIEVLLKDGTRFTGLLLEEKPHELVVRVDRIDTTFETSRVERYRVLPSLLERYEQMRAAIGEDPQQLRALVEWLRERGEYALALREADRLVALRPNDDEYRALHVLIAQQLQLAQRAGAAVTDRGSRRPRVGKDEFPLLTEDEINLLKIYEIDLDRPPGLIIQRETIDRLLAEYATSPLIPVTQEGRDAIYFKPPAEVLQLMFRLRAREFYNEVRVRRGDQPEVFEQFRDDVHRTWLINGCATTQCHGGAEAGRFYLYNQRANSEPAVYTNYLILQKFRLPGEIPLLDYDNPEQSPLLQFGLPREDSLFPHPEVPSGASGRDAWRPLFRSRDDRRYRRTVEWIGNLYRPRMEYPIDYELPTPPGVSPPGSPEEEPGGR